jgi:hypothetical protein
MRNYKGYVAVDWMEACLQIRSVDFLMGALLGTIHPVIMCYKVFRRKYDAMEPRIRREFELVHGARLGPALVVSHVQLMWRSWLSDQVGSENHLPLPDFCPPT